MSLEVMKCIVEALADVLSMPHPVPVSQECLDTLRTGKTSTRDLTPPGPHPRPYPTWPSPKAVSQALCFSDHYIYPSGSRPSLTL